MVYSGYIFETIGLHVFQKASASIVHVLKTDHESMHLVLVGLMRQADRHTTIWLFKKYLT